MLINLNMYPLYPLQMDDLVKYCLSYVFVELKTRLCLQKEICIVYFQSTLVRQVIMPFADQMDIQMECDQKWDSLI